MANEVMNTNATKDLVVIYRFNLQHSKRFRREIASPGLIGSAVDRSD